MTKTGNNLFRMGWWPGLGAEIQSKQCSISAPGRPQQRSPPKLPTTTVLMPAIALTVSKGLVSDRALKFSIISAYIRKATCAGIRPSRSASLRTRQFGEAWCGS